jgi:glycosyltransferase involved in cell wall biosynthesis
VRQKGKLLFVINGLGPGGAERSLVETVPRLNALGFQTKIVCLGNAWGDQFVDEARERDLDVQILKSTGWIGRAVELRGIIRDERPDVVHTTLFHSDIIGRFAAIGSGGSVVGTLANASYDPARFADPNLQSWRLNATRLLDGWTARHLSDRFHALTNAVGNATVRDLHIDPARIVVIPRGRARDRLGFPSVDRRRAKRLELGIDESSEVIINVGRQEYQKGQQDLIAAVALLAPQRPNLVVLIVGRKGNATEVLKESVKEHGLTDVITFLGHREDVGDLLAAADVFVFPSLFEGLGGAVIEAEALGLPIVASNLPVLQEVVEDEQNGILTPAEDPVALAAAIERLLEDDRERALFGGRSIEVFNERFTLDLVQERMGRFYDDLVES